MKKILLILALLGFVSQAFAIDMFFVNNSARVLKGQVTKLAFHFSGQSDTKGQVILTGATSAIQGRLLFVNEGAALDMYKLLQEPEYQNSTIECHITTDPNSTNIAQCIVWRFFKK